MKKRVGKVERILIKQNPSRIDINVIEDIENNTVVQFQTKKMIASASVLQIGDTVSIDVIEKGQFDKYGNHYNNVIATKVTRL